MSEYLKQHGRSLIENGFNIIPIPPGSKSPGFDGWQNTRATKGLLAEWLSDGHWDSGVGILTKEHPAIDLDILDQRVAEKIEAWCMENIGDCPVRIGRAPRRLLLTRAITPFRKMKTGKYKDEWGDSHEVEILGEGQQFVAYALHKDTNLPYEWTSEQHPAAMEASDLPVLTMELAQDLIKFAVQCFEEEGWERQSSGINTGGKAVTLSDDPFAEVETKVDLPIKELRKRLMMIPGAEDHDLWFQIGMALYHQFDGNDDGLALWHEWSENAANYDSKALDKRYKTFGIEGEKRAPITARLIIKLANEEMYKAKTWQPPEAITKEEWQYSRLHQDCIIQDLIYADVALLVAPGGVGKTTFLLFLLVHVVLGVPFLGRDIKRKNKVLFVTAEDSREILIARLRNICIDMGLDQLEIDIVRRDILIADVSGSSFKLTMVVGDVVIPSLQVDEIISQYEKDELSIVVFDPVVSFGVGESRVNDAEQGLVTAGRIIRNKLNCCTLFVHHTGKANAREKTLDQYTGRGGSALPDGSRMVFALQNLSPADFKKQTGTELAIGSESGFIFNPAKLTPTKPQEPIYLKRSGYSFKTINRVIKDASQLVYEHADIVWQALNTELINDKYHSKKSFEAIKTNYGLTQNECRAAFATLEAQGRIEERLRPKSTGRGGAHKYLHPVDLGNNYASSEINNEPIENDQL